MEQQTFRYKSTFLPWIFLPALVFGALAVYSFINDIDFSYRGRIFLENPISYYVTGVLCLAFMAYAFHKLLAHKNSRHNNANIVLGERGLRFPYKKATVSVNFNEINEFYIKNDSDDGEQVIIYTGPKNTRYVFSHDCFESTELYIKFKSLMENGYDNNNN